MNRFIICMTIMLCVNFMTANSNTTDEFKPGGNPVVRIYTNAYTILTDVTNKSAFQVTRAYLGYQYRFSPRFSSVAIVDAADQNADGSVTARVKNAYVRYTTSRTDATLGMVSTTLARLQDKMWGFRYVDKSFLDAYSFYSSADYGLTIDYQVTEFLSADLIIANGEGYKTVESDSVIKAGLGITVAPLREVTCRVYGDLSHKQATLSTISVFAGYKTELLSLCGEYNLQNNRRFVEGHNLRGVSFYSTVSVADKIKVYARYDKLWSADPGETNPAWNRDNDGQLFMGGVEYAPVKGIKMSPNISGWHPASGNRTDSLLMRISFEAYF